MQSKSVPVSYRDKTQDPPKNMSLGNVDVDVPDSVEEAVALYGGGDDEKGVTKLLAHASAAYIIDKQTAFREANRPDKAKTTSNLAKFKVLSEAMQIELLEKANLL
ncbi:hypothetical protein LCGC14_2476410 [marine sediment metagenome]|uniref:Uncharacterized protein n=1 Tax=marine sediment metagenome TaxID=412755 RepID=A0A0F9E2P1_9ZZZZ